jgi:tape measure domain-containing protein
MTTVDKRVVEMGFDNRQFESGVQTSVKSLDTLKKGLNLDEAARSLSNLANVGKSFTLGGIANGVETISSKFNALGVIGFTVLQNLTNGFITLTENIAKAVLGLDQIKSGFGEYEASLTAFQTILANTKTAGTTVKDVNKALAELSKYANLTIYSFGDMTTAIGQFTSQGVKLDDSVTAIKGIYNVMALTGGDASKAKNLIYQLSQAIAGGTVRLMDWNSVVNSGIAGPDFQNQLKQTARIHGVQVDAIIAKQGSFRESLQEGWLTSQILLETLQQYTGDLSTSQLKSMGYTEAQIKQIQELGSRANESATKMKSFTQLIETLTSNTVTGWATSFKMIIGNLDQASSLWTDIGAIIGNVLQGSADARNELIEGWARFGGRITLVDAIHKALEGILSIVEPVKQAFKEIFPPVTSHQLQLLTMGLRDLTAKLIIGSETASELKRTFKGVFAIFDIAATIITRLVTQFAKLTGSILPSGSSILDFTANIGDWLVKLRDAIKYGDAFGKIFGKIRTFLEPVGKIFSSILTTIGPVFGKIKDFIISASDIFKNVDTSGLDIFASKVKGRFEPLTALFTTVGKVSSWLWNTLIQLIPLLTKVGGFIGRAIGDIASGLIKGLENINYNDIFDTLNGGLISALILAIRNFVNKGSDVFSSIKDILDGVGGSLKAWQENLKAKTLLTIASAVGILALSLIGLSTIDSGKLSVALGAMSVMFAELIGAMSLFDKLPGGKGLNEIAGQMLLIAASMLILSFAIKEIGKLSVKQMIKGLVGVGVVLAEIAIFMKVTDLNGMGIKSSIGILILAGALLVLAKSVEQFGKLDPKVLEQGLKGIAGILLELAIFTKVTGDAKSVIATATGLIILGVAMLIFAKAISVMGSLSVDQITKGLEAMGGSLAIVAIAMRFMPKDMLLIAAGLLIVAGSLVILSSALTTMGNLSMEQISNGMKSLGGSLGIIAIAMRLMPKDMLLTAAGLAVVAGSLVILSGALTTMGNMSVDQINNSLVTLGFSLGILSVAIKSMTGSLSGSAALLAAAAALFVLAPALKALGSMPLSEIGNALIAMAATFVVLGVAGTLLIEAVPGMLGLAGAIALMGLAFLAAGAGVLAFSAGLAALSVSGVAGAAALVIIITSLISLLPMIYVKMAEAMIAFLGVIIISAPVISKAFIAIMGAILSAIIEVAPQILIALGVVLVSLIALIVAVYPQMVEAAWGLLSALLQTIAAHLPDIITAGVSIIVSILQGITDNINKVVTAGVNMIAAYIEAISGQQRKIIDAGIKAVIAFINGVADGIRDNKKALAEAGKNLASALISGLTNGLSDGVSNIVEAVTKLGSSMLTTLKNILGIKSPSKETYKIGEYVTEGFVNGILSGVESSKKATSQLASTAISSLNTAISSMSNAINSNIDVSPSIRPVIDLSEIVNGGKEIDKIFNSKKFSISTSIDRLTPITVGMQGSKNSENRINQPSTSETSVSFVQNNYSPTALSQIEIYRQTKNQLSAMKGLLGI